MRGVDVLPEVVDRMQDLEREAPESLKLFYDTADDAHRNANDAYRQLPLKHGVHIPIDVSREDEVEQTLQVVRTDADQTEALPHILISANHVPIGANKDLVAHNIDVIRSFQRSESDLPFSYFTRENTPGTPIGFTRDSIAWSSIIAHVRYSIKRNIPLEDVPLTTWDADTLGSSPGYLKQIYLRHAASEAEMFAAGPLVAHQKLDADIFPAANRLLSWHDRIQQATGQSRPNSFTTNIVGFARGRGFGMSRVSESARLIERASRATSPEQIDIQQLDATVITSSRRLVGKMATGANLYYTELDAQPSQAGSVSGDTLTQDVGRTYYRDQLGKVVLLVMVTAFFDKKEKLDATKVPQSDREAVAVEYARQVARTTAAELGDDLYADQDVVNTLIEHFPPTYFRQHV